MEKIKNSLFFIAYLFLNPHLLRPFFKGLYLPVYVQYEQFKKYNIKTIIDIGASSGRVARALNYLFPDAKIYAFEPLIQNHSLIKDKIPKDKLVLSRLALSNQKGKAVFYQNSYSPMSSLLPLSQKIRKRYQSLAKVKKIIVTTTTLDDYFRNKKLEEEIFLKIDVQGAERLILEGGRDLLEKVSLIHIEISFNKWYQKQSVFDDIYRCLIDLGFDYLGEVLEAEFYPLFNLQDSKNAVFMRSKIKKDYQMGAHSDFSQNLKDEKKVFNRFFRRKLILESNLSHNLALYRSVGLLNISKQSSELLDLGCGDGTHAVNLAKLGFRVTGLDIAEEGIREAKRRAKEEGVKVKFLVGDAVKTGFPRKHFDVIVFIGALHHFYYANIDQVLSEAKRILKRGGLMAIIEPNNLNPYNFLCYLIAHFFKRHSRFIRLKYLEEMFTVNERSLNPYHLFRKIDQSYKMVSLNFFHHTAVLARDNKNKGNDWSKRIRQIFNYVCLPLADRFRFDFFSMCLVKRN